MLVLNSQPGSTVRFTGALITDLLTIPPGLYDVNIEGSGTAITIADLRNDGIVTFGNASPDTLNFGTDLTVDIPSAVQLFGQIRTAGDDVTLGDGNTSVRVYRADSVIDTTNNGVVPAGALITFLGVLDGMTGTGSENLRLDAGTAGDILFVTDVGSMTRLGTLQITNAHDVTIENIAAEAFLQDTGTGTTTLNQTVNTNTASGVNLLTLNLVIHSSITTTGSGVVDLSATSGGSSPTNGLITLNNNAIIVATGNVTLTGSRSTGDAIIVKAVGAFDVNGNTITGETRQFITTTTGASVTINSSMGFFTSLPTGYDEFVINTKSGSGSINLNAALDANYNNFTLTAGNGTVTSAPTAAFTEVNTLTLNDNTSASTGIVNLSGNLTVEWIDTFSQPYTVNLLGSSNIIGPHLYDRYGNVNSTMFLNTNGVSLGNNSTDYFWFRQNLTSTAGTTSVAGRIEAEGELTFANVALLDTASIISLGGGNVVMADVSGAGKSMKFGEDAGGLMNYTITGNAVIGEITTYPFATWKTESRIRFLGSLTVAFSATTDFLNSTVQFGDGVGNDLISFPNGVSLAAVANRTLGGRL
ncbi:MAG: hypothetical protein WCK86_24090, partial [Planctomycetia bacterium]